MSKNLLREYYELCPGGICDDLLTEAEKRFVANGGLILSGVMQRCDEQNGNGRIYPRPILEREVERYMTLIRENRALGELDHPDDSVVNLRNASHMITKIWWKGNDVMGKAKILNTPSGQILKALVESGVKLGISSRGLGSVRENRGQTIVEDDFNLICFDFVSDPSTTGAFMIKESKGDQNSVLINLTEKLDKLISIIEKESNPPRVEKISNIINRLVKGE
tara:strand:- start:1462 stop:2127 length:666 start_codon:yes stop_codon:yes gene_type:complete